MIKILPQINIPHKVTIAFSGGIDSLAIAHFLKNGKRDITLAHFNHGCPVSDAIEKDCRTLADTLQCPIIVKRIDDPVCPSGCSIEDFWRRNRYRWLRSLDSSVITGHHLNDAVETWLWSAMHGNPKLIPAESGNVIRPFLITPKSEFEKLCYSEEIFDLDIEPVLDIMNNDMSKMRNYMRKELMPVVKHINPGIEKVIIKKYLENENGW